jgi:Flp pilus assembly protein TadG
MFGLAAIPLLAGIGVATDMVAFNRTQTILQGAVDAAALAAASNTKFNNEGAIKKIVADYLKANNAYDSLSIVNSVTQTRDVALGTMSVTIRGSIKTQFMSILGFISMDAGASSEVSLGMRALELALVLDNTGSMSGTKIQNLKTSAKKLVSILEDAKADYSDVKYSLVPFAQYVNVGLPNANSSWVALPSSASSTWSGCMGSRTSPLDEQVGAFGGKIPAANNANCSLPILPLTNNISVVNQQIDYMVAAGSTYIPTGLLWGWNVLDPTEPFTEGRTNAQLSEINGHKALVLMTDGENTASPIYPDHDGKDAALANSKLATLCSAVKRDDIEVFTVSFQVPTPNIKAILESCASDVDHSFDADNGQALFDAFTQIGKMLSGVRLSK